ncbi:MAG TPA: hypothetical protein VFG15_30160 [Amycolatopsis sp.]|nr:hypothetical protein [Amycolatopsis sp.]
MSVTLSASLPSDDRQGLGAISAALVENSQAAHLVVAVVDCSKITTKIDSGDIVPTARILAIEGFEGHTEVAKQLREIVRRQYAQRTGREELPFDGTAPAAAD